MWDRTALRLSILRIRPRFCEGTYVYEPCSLLAFLVECFYYSITNANNVRTDLDIPTFKFKTSLHFEARLYYWNIYFSQLAQLSIKQYTCAIGVTANNTILTQYTQSESISILIIHFCVTHSLDFMQTCIYVR